MTFPVTPRQQDAYDKLMAKYPKRTGFYAKVRNNRPGGIEPKLRMNGFGVYFLRLIIPEIPGKNYVKVGHTETPNTRRSGIKSNNPFPSEFIYNFLLCDGRHEAMRVETYFKNQFGPKRISGEWFDVTEEDITSVEIPKKHETILIEPALILADWD